MIKKTPEEIKERKRIYNKKYRTRSYVKKNKHLEYLKYKLKPKKSLSDREWFKIHKNDPVYKYTPSNYNKIKHDIEQSRIKNNLRNSNNYYKNKKEIDKKHADYKKKYPEKIKLQRQKYFKTESYIIAQRRYEKSDKGRLSKQMRHHANKTLGIINSDLWKIKCEILNNQCQLCKAYMSNNLVSVDHIIPVVKGGTHEISNLQPLCKSCNSRKGSKSMEEMEKIYTKYGDIITA